MAARSPVQVRNLVAALALSLYVATVLPLSLKAVGSGSFTPHPTTPSFGGGDSADVLLGDLDLDGDLDALVVGFFVPQTVWINDGTGRVSAHSTKPSFSAGDSINATLGDVDGDGDLDAVVADVNGAETVWVNDRTGGFTPHPTTPTFNPGLSSTADVVLGDLDGDNDLDAVLANYGEPERVWLNDSTGRFTAHPTAPSFGAGLSQTLALGDLDGDNDLDVVVANYGGEAETVWINAGGGRFVAHPSAPSFGGGDSNAVALGDLDGDGDLDAVVANAGQAKTVWLNDGTGKFSAHPSTPALSVDTSVDVALGDLDGDTDLDAVFVAFGQSESVWLNDGSGNFSAHPTTPTFGAGWRSYRVSLGDLDGDDDLDAVVANNFEEAETVWVNLAPNTPPTAVADSYPANEDQTLTVAAPGVLGNDTDADTGDTRTAVLVSGPAHGLLTLNANGSFSYAPAANYNGPDSFSYKARDAKGAESAAVTVTITVNPVNDPPTITPDSYSVNEDQTLTVGAPGVLGNDADVDASDTRTAVLVSGPAHAASLTLNAEGSFSYAPAANYNGPDSFSYKARDAAGAESAPATVTITVNAVSDAPTIAVAGGGQCLSDNGGRIALVIADVDTPAAGLTLGASSSNAQLVPVSNITFGGAGATRTVTITTVADRTGSAILTLSIDDGLSTRTTIVAVAVGGNGNDTLTGTDSADALFGQNGDDRLIGGGSADLLCGGRGNDTMTGGLGADGFSGGQGTDTATDFTPGQGDTTDGTVP